MYELTEEAFHELTEKDLRANGGRVLQLTQDVCLEFP